jgi:hypothetical protein
MVKKENILLKKIILILFLSLVLVMVKLPLRYPFIKMMLENQVDGYYLHKQYELHGKDLVLMNDIQSFFSVGTIKIRSRDGHVIYYVNSLKNLTTTIIPHFEKYRLLTQKKVDFELFKQIVFMMNNKEHLTPEGLRKIISIRASLNEGLGETISADFPGIIPIDRPLVDEAKISDPQ